MMDEVSRRRLLNRVLLGVTGLAGAAFSVPLLGYLLSPLIKRPAQVWRDVGAVDQFTIGQTKEVAYEDPSPQPWAGQTAKTAAWLRRGGETDFTAFAVNCTHLGCPVSWLSDAKLFLCPCHGGIFNADGTVAGGPPQRPLWKHQVRVRNGRVEIDTRPLPAA